MTWAITPVREDKEISLRSMIVARGKSLGWVGGWSKCWRGVGGVTFVTFATWVMALLHRTSLGVDLTISPPLETWLHPDSMLCCSGESWQSFLALGSAVGWRLGPFLLKTRGSALLPLITTTIVSSVLGVTVCTPFLFLCHNALPVCTSKGNHNYASCDWSTVWVPWEPSTYWLSLWDHRETSKHAPCWQGACELLLLWSAVWETWPLQGQDQGTVCWARAPNKLEFRGFWALPWYSAWAYPRWDPLSVA